MSPCDKFNPEDWYEEIPVNIDDVEEVEYPILDEEEYPEYEDYIQILYEEYIKKRPEDAEGWEDYYEQE